MTKGFYKLMCFATAAAMSIIGCGPEDDPTVEYGAPVDYDQYQTDNENGLPDDYMDTPIYGADAVKYDEDTLITDTDEPVVTPDDPAMEYGPVQTDYDAAVPDDSMDTIYGVESVYFDDADPVEQPDEMTTDYGPVSRSFLKK